MQAESSPVRGKGICKSLTDPRCESISMRSNIRTFAGRWPKAPRAIQDTIVYLTRFVEYLSFFKESSVTRCAWGGLCQSGYINTGARTRHMQGRGHSLHIIFVAAPPIGAQTVLCLLHDLLKVACTAKPSFLGIMLATLAPPARATLRILHFFPPHSLTNRLVLPPDEPIYR